MKAEHKGGGGGYMNRIVVGIAKPSMQYCIIGTNLSVLCYTGSVTTVFAATVFKKKDDFST